MDKELESRKVNTTEKPLKGENWLGFGSKKNYIYRWGDFDKINVGIRPNVKRLYPKPYAKESISALGEVIVAVATGSQHGAILTYEGKVYVFGKNFHWQLGEMDHSTAFYQPTILQAFLTRSIKICSLAVGSSYCVVASNDGRVFSWGSSLSGALGHGVDVDQVTRPRQVTGKLVGAKITLVASSTRHVVAATDNGSVFSWGLSEGGALGLGREMPNEWTPCELDTAFDGVIALSCGPKMTAVVARNKTGRTCLYTCGLGTDGRLGNGDTISLWKLSIAKKNFPEVLCSVSCGARHCLALDLSGHVFSWGCNDDQRLGRKARSGTREALLPAMVEVDGVPIIAASISVGKDHSALVTKTGKLYTFGSNRSYELGRDREPYTSEDEPGLVPSLHNNNLFVEGVYCGDGRTMAIVHDSTWNEQDESLTTDAEPDKVDTSYLTAQVEHKDERFKRLGLKSREQYYLEMHLKRFFID